MAEPIKYVSPSGALILGTLERLEARADISGFDPDTGEPEYTGNTEMFWDGQGMIFLDEDGAEWTFDQLTPAPEDEEAAV